jgi:hypothetical protein
MTELETKATPTTAERIRSAFARAGGAMLAVEGLEPAESPVHHLLEDGSFAITVPIDGAVAHMAVSAGADGVQAVLEMTDYAPLPLREPVRSLVWIRGRLHDVPSGEVSALLDLIAAEDPNPALLQVNSGPADSEKDTRYALMRLEIDSVVVADSTGAESVGLSALLGARPDPFCAMESCWLQHMESAHRGWSTGWPADCPARCAADASVPSAWIATVSSCVSRAMTATTTFGCPSRSRSTTSAVCPRRSGF